MYKLINRFSEDIDISIMKSHFGYIDDNDPENIILIIEEEIPNSIKNSITLIRVLDAERTFWEKATILHMLSHYPENKIIPLRNNHELAIRRRFVGSNFINRAIINKRMLCML